MTNEQIASETRTEITESFPSVVMGSIELCGSCCVLTSEIQFVGEEGKMRLFVCECCAGGGKENGVFSLRSALEDRYHCMSCESFLGRGRASVCSLDLVFTRDAASSKFQWEKCCTV